MESATLIFAVAAVSYTVAKGSIFNTPRDWLYEKNAFVGELFSCPFCFAHWAAAVALLWTGHWSILNWLALTGASSVVIKYLVKP